MYKWEPTYKDYNGDEVTKAFYFNLNKAEVAEMELTTEGGLADRLDRIIKAKDTPSVIKEFKRLILASYGEKSDVGQRFMKSEEISKKFEATPAYEILFMDLVTDEKKASEFINAIVPQDKSANTQEQQGLPKKQNNPVPMPTR